jgi:predicted TIM-barrel fold metal-dependent hydrolase
MASLTPHQDEGAYRAEVERCVRELGFVAVKAHVLGHAINPRTRDARLIFQTAADLGIAVMIHTGHGVPFAEPAMWVPLAREFSETTVILGHAGAPMFTGPAIVAAEVTPNIVLETSWCAPHDIGRAVRTLGPGRVMFGSDLLFNPGLELAKYRAIGLPDETVEQCLGRTATAVYRLPAAVPAA